ncbi:MAG TPA: ATP-binding protein [Bacteroidales bacterium]|nr:ATP-binding protein [Bacteroidales bacterium]
MGYDFPTAVADLIDNSIDAGATEIHITVQFDGDKSWVSIADNGKGMSGDEIKEALRFGSETEYNMNNLGKFGLGLKTASLSQCQVLSVASRADPEKTQISAYCWDLNHIEKVNRWEILPIKTDEMHHVLRDPLLTSTGTVVMWQKLDRILGYKNPYGEFAKKRMAAMCRELEEHLAMVFHRFIMGESRRQTIKIFLNNNLIRPWDPFARSEAKTWILESTEIPCELEDIKGTIYIQPYILPHKDEFSTRDAWEYASGPKKWNQQQGLYIYRGDRLIQSGGWSYLRTIDEHTKLARIAISFSPDLDEAFKINVAKMRVQLPIEIQEKLKQIIEPVVRQARDRYDRPPVHSIISPINLPATTTRQNSNPAPNPVRITNPENFGCQTSLPLRKQIHDIFPVSKTASTAEDRKWTLDEIERNLEKVAEPEEREIIVRVFAKLRQFLSK